MPDPAGEVAEQLVEEMQLTPVPAVAPKATAVEPGTKFVPVMVIVVPPAAGPLDWDRLVTVGAGGGVGL
jgi:hypothetical protein